MFVLEITQEEANLIKLIRKIGYGSLSEVIIQDKKPVMVKVTTQTIKLDPLDKD